MKLLFVICFALALSHGPAASAESISLQGDFRATVTGGYVFSGAFRGTIPGALPSGNASFRSDDFTFFEAHLSPSTIGDTLFDSSNLEVLLTYDDGAFTQLWFGGDTRGPEGLHEGMDDFFVQWSLETGTPPDTGFFSVTGSSDDVAFVGGDLRISIVPEPKAWALGLITGATLIVCSRTSLINWDRGRRRMPSCFSM